MIKDNSGKFQDKITKKHDQHLNNPFPSPPQSSPVVQGKLVFNSQTLPSHRIYDIGNDFQLNWSSKDGGFLSLSHKSQPTRLLWSTLPGQAFVSAAVAETEVEESRGSFHVKDGRVHLVCNHQTIDYIGVARDESKSNPFKEDQDFPTDEKEEDDGDQSPAVMISGKIISAKKKKVESSQKDYAADNVVDECTTSARYWILIDQKNSNQIGFQVRLGKPNVELQKRVSPKVYKGFSRKVTAIRRRWVGRKGLLSRKKVYVTVSSSSDDENVVMKDARLAEFNRIWLTYASEKSEKFFGFAEQFSHMNFKGKTVPIFVQEQGIGRGDQLITFAANLVSYR